MTKRFFNSKYVEKVGKISSKKSEKYQNVPCKKGYKYFSNQTLMERSTNFEDWSGLWRVTLSLFVLFRINFNNIKCNALVNLVDV